MKTIHYLYISVIAIFLFFFLSIFIINGNYIFYDAPIYNFISRFSYPDFFLFVTKFGDAIFILFCLCVSLVFLREMRARKFISLIMLVEISLNVGLKLFFGRARPNVVHLIEETSYAFPSGHAMASTTFYLLIIYFLWNTNLNKPLKIAFTIFLVLLILFICISRIYLGVHYASDILGGLLLGVFLVSFGIFLYQSIHK